MKKVLFYVDSDLVVRDEKAAHRVYFHKVGTLNPIRGSKGEMVLLKDQILQEELESWKDRASKTKNLRESDEYKKLRYQLFDENKTENGGVIICQYCGRECNRKHEDPAQATIDHILDLKYGGDGLARDNLIVCCRECNRAKRYFKGSVEEYKKIRTNKIKK